MQKIAIIGGGIGGLCTAIALQRHTPYQVIVYESAAEIKNVGAGLLLAANALKALDYIGIKKEVLSVGHLQNTFAIIDQNGKIITKPTASA
jgi:2-polyprenyl-6-methoxyphenol hydroxylase-like FAD-dependent oxidoreductase